MKNRIKIFEVIIILFVFFLIASCATLPKLPNTANFDSHKREIKTIAVLPLVIGDEKGAFHGKLKDVKAFAVYWQLEFNNAFKKEIKFIDDVEIKYWGEDFDITVPNDADYGKIMNELEVDAVLCFCLIEYDEHKAGEKIAGMVSNLLFGTVDPKMGRASFILHSYYLHQEDWATRIVCEAIPGTIEGQREQFIYGLLIWMDKNWPLSINYVQREKA